MCPHGQPQMTTNKVIIVDFTIGLKNGDGEIRRLNPRKYYTSIVCIISKLRNVEINCASRQEEKTFPDREMLFSSERFLIGKLFPDSGIVSESGK